MYLQEKNKNTKMKMSSSSSIIFLIIAALHINEIYGAEVTPMCNYCDCSKTATNKNNVDCSNKEVLDHFLFNPANWYDSNHNLYPIETAKFSGSRIGDLGQQFVLSNVTVLDLSNNYIRFINNSCFANLQNMHTLILSHNLIEQLKSEVFKGMRVDNEDYPLRSLTTLKLNENNFHTLHQDVFAHIEDQLEVLDLSYNPFKVIDQSTAIAISGIINLKELYLRFTRLSTLPEHFLHTPRHLKVLDLTGNSFTQVPPGLEEAHVLETLFFNDNDITNLTAENGFPNITTLKILHMTEMVELEEIQAGAFSKLTNLEELHVRNNIKLGKIDPASLSHKFEETEIWPPLKKLDLSGNKLTRLDLHLIVNWDHLSELDLRYNPWTCECENQWIVDTLMPIYITIDETKAKEVKCAAPIEMEGKTFYDEFKGNKSMRCLDLFGNQPERDASVLIGILIGLLVGIPLILLVIFAYQRHWFGLFDSSPAAFSRQFYSRTRADEL